MKKSFILACFLIAACTSTPEVKPVYQAQTRPVYNTNCCTSSRTVRKPVEIIYEDTTYTTVYEPKTYISTKRVSMPYNDCTIKSLCR